MLNSPGCIPCIVSQSYTLSNLLGIKDKDTQNKIIFETMELMLLNKNIPSAPHFSLIMLDVLKKYTNVNDQFSALKEKNRPNVEKYVKYLSILIDEAEDKLEMALKISIMGNTIDLAANPNYDLEKEINLITSNNFNLTDYKKFKDELKTAKQILFIADNFEEAIFDKLLIKQLLPINIVFAVRSNEVYNDITLKDSKTLEIDKLCKVIESGSKIAGTALEQCTQEFIDLYNSSDIVISKGQGNYETLLNADRPIYFLFKVKCPTIAEICGNKVGTSVMYYKK